MPYVIPRPKRLQSALLAAIAAIALALVVVPAAHACVDTPTSNPFALFGDSADYSLIPGGSFESGTADWTLTGATLAYGNEKWKVGGYGDSKSLAISPSGQAVSPAFCVSIRHPTFRFFARRTSGAWGQLNVTLRWTLSGVSHDTPVGAVNGYDYWWHPSAPTPLGSALPVAGDDLTVQIVFDPAATGGAWAIDDIYADPYTRG